jgi:hypothetical protein
MSLRGRQATAFNVSLRGAKRRGNLGFSTAIREDRDCFAPLAMTYREVVGYSSVLYPVQAGCSDYGGEYATTLF